ncbi:MFS transporter [Nocardia jiangxiensis]|uniref:MFS transporter n=1 Tax=Nocardia jiangxiensis TaxID=282685 RepID=UPI000594F4A1|nr:MFS transporter [Nocardia jiangxiensis]
MWLVPQLICWLALIADGYEVFVYGATLPLIIHEKTWGITAASAGTVGSVSLVGLLIGAFGAGTLTDVFGRRRLFLFSLTFYSLSALFCAAAANLATFGAARFMTGLGIGGMMPIVVSIASEFAPPRYRHRVVCAVLTGPFFGAVVASFAALVLLPHGSFRAVYALGAIPLVTVLPMAFAWLPESMSYLWLHRQELEAGIVASKYGLDESTEKVADVRPARSPIVALFQPQYRWATIGFWLTMVIILLIIYATSTWLPHFMVQAGFPLGSSLEFLMLYSVSSIIGSVIVSWIAERTGARTMIVIGFFLCAAGFVLIAGASRIAAICAVVVAGFGTAAVLNLMLDHIAGFYPAAARATGVGWANGVGRFGAIAGPSYGGMVLTISHGSPMIAALGFALPAILGGLVVGIPLQRSPQSGSASAAPQR